MKYIIDLIVNKILLKPFKLKVAYRSGSNPIDDIKTLLGNDSVKYIVDGGAYRGDFSLDMAKAFPNAAILAFEPQNNSFALLSKNTATIDRIKPVNYALGNKNGQALFYTNVSPLTNSLSKSTSDAMEYFRGFNDLKTTENVDVITLLDFCSKEGICDIDILKLDLQGHELQAIQGLGVLLNSVKLIYAEVEFLKLYEGASLFSDIELYLRERGFLFFQLYGLVRSPKNGRLLYGDAVFVNSKCISI